MKNLIFSLIFVVLAFTSYSQINSSSDGSDGALTVTSLNTQVNEYTHLMGNQIIGESIITVDNSNQFLLDDQIMIIQMQTTNGGTSGVYEIATINSINGNLIGLSSALTHDFYSSYFDRVNATVTQVLRIPQYTTVNIELGASIIAKSWDGYSGGIVAFKAINNVINDGLVSVKAMGFRGGYEQTNGNASQGESYTGQGLVGQKTNNAGGGGFGSQTSYAAGGKGAHGGGGGGHHTNGGDGYLSLGSPVTRPMGGVAYSDSTAMLLTFGSAGGAGGDDSYNQVDPTGGNGSGIILIISASITNNGTIDASGGNGTNGVGGLKGGAGAGAGGYVYTSTIQGSGTVNIQGGSGGSPSCCGRGAGGFGGLGFEFTNTSSPIILNTPSNLVAMAVSQNQIDLNWTDNLTNEQGYSIERSNKVGGIYSQIGWVNQDSTSFQDFSSLNANSEYFYRVRGLDSLSSYTSFSNIDSAITYPFVPNSCTNLSSTTVSYSAIDLTWTDNSNNELGFIISRATNVGSFVTIDTVGANTLVYSDTGLNHTTNYSYQVISYNIGGNATNSNIATSATFSLVPSAASNLSATATTSLQIDLAWTDNATNETAYQIKRSLSFNGVYTEIALLPANSITYVDHSGLSVNTEYFYRVVAQNQGGENGSSIDSATTLSNCSYQLESTTINCADASFCLPLSTGSIVNNGTGFDFNLKYDTSHYDFNGISIDPNIINDPNNVAYSTYVNPDGSINFTIYIKGSAPSNTYFNGTGNVLCIDFTKHLDHEQGLDEFSLSSIMESYAASTQLHCVDTSIVVVTKDAIANARLLTWNNMSAMSYDPANPNSFLVTKIFGISDSCSAKSSSFVTPNLNGQIEHSINNGKYISIERDIDSSSQVMPFVNGYDALLARKIALGDHSFLPNVYQALASDVNMDGEITAGDVSLILKRTTLNIFEFPQAWNHPNGISNGNPSKDWLFLDTLNISNLPSFQISSTYPLSDGSGFNRLNIPAIPSCLEVPITYTGNCPSIASSTFIGVLVGDVDGNFNQFGAGAKLKGNSGSELIFDLDAAIPVSECIVDIPFFANTNGGICNSLDFKMDYDHLSLDLISVNYANSIIEMLHNEYDDQLLFSSYSSVNYPSLTPIGFVRFQINNNSVDFSDFGNIDTYINGNSVQHSIKGSYSCSTISLEESLEDLSNSIQLYPNPADGILNFNLVASKEIKVEIHNATGKKVFQTRFENVVYQQQEKIDIAHLKTGVYFVKILVDNQLVVKEIVKY